MSVVHIYQFCRAFDNVRWSDVYQCYVSGGYAFEKIARASYEVPPEIREAVINDDFKLNDNYPPEKNDFALIAREIDNKYSVLAVANRQLDDGGRPTIGYKYFWLEKSSPSVDGIGTLIYWWRDNQFQFNMAELVETSPPQILYTQGEEEKINFYLQANWLEDTRKTVNNLKEIPKISVVTKDNWQELELPPYIKLHYLALGLSLRAKNTNSPNAWAWNVQKLAHPDSFISIFYATQEDIPSNIPIRNLPALHLVSPQTHNPNDPTPDKAQPESPTPLPSKTSNSITPAVEKNIKSFLSSLANTVNQNGLNEKIQELFGYLRDYADADWTNCIDKTRVTASSPHDIYPQLIYLVAPNNPSSKKWLLQMVESLEIDTQPTSSDWISTARNWANPSESNKQPDISNFQRFLLEASDDQDHQVIYKLRNSIYFGISFLLDKLINPDQMININEAKVMAQKIDYLLTRSQGIWQKDFQKYTEIIAQIILYQENEKTVNYHPAITTFCQPILDIIPKLKNLHEQNRRYHYGNYRSLAIIFSKTHRKDLAEFFYRMSGTNRDNIPADVRNSLDAQIRSRIFYVPNQTRMSSNSSNNGDSSSEGDRVANAVIVCVLFCIVALIFFMAKGFDPKKTQQSDNIDDSKSTFCGQTNVNLLENFKNYKECYLEENKEIPAQKLEKFIPKGSPIESKKQHLEQIKNYFRNIKDEDTFNNKIKQLSKCKNKPSLDFDKCLNPDIFDFDLMKQEILKKFPQPLKNNLEHLLKKDKKKSKG
jgi:hypothetical protein